MKLADSFNKYEVNFELCKTAIGTRVKLNVSPEDDSLFDAEGNVIDAAFDNFLDLLSKVKAYIYYNPRNKDAGFVVYAEAEDQTAWYDAVGECAWISC